MADVGTQPHHIRQSRLPRDRGLAAIAERQHGLVTRDQLRRELGFGLAAIRYRVEAGRLYVIHPGVYSLGRSRALGLEHWMAAVLACGEVALLSHVSAAALWGFVRSEGLRVDVTTTMRGCKPKRNVIPHRVRRLQAADRAEMDGIPVTSVPRTLLDLAETVSSHRLERAFEEAERLRLLDVNAVVELCARSRGRRGVKPLRALVAHHAQPVDDTRSELEWRFLRLCRDAGLPRPSMNVSVAGLEVDALWQDARLVVEIDGYAFHGTRMAFERDRARDIRLQVAGYRVIRITHKMLENEPHDVVRRIRSLLGASTPLAVTPVAVPNAVRSERVQ